MTIVEAIVEVLNHKNVSMTSREIYKEIVNQNLYAFGAKDPVGVVNAQIRRRCDGLDFPTAYPNKLFQIVGHRGKKPLFSLLLKTDDNQNKEQLSENIDLLPEEKVGIAYAEHVENIRVQVFDFVLKNNPKFFEHLVMDLLLKMGYGYDKNSGVVTGRSHDGV